MAQSRDRLNTDISNFRYRILTDPTEVLDPEGVVHHEFVSGNHGRKLDFDRIIEGTDFYIDWVAIYARAILAAHARRLPDALVGIANGANRLSLSIAPLLGKGVVGLTTRKVDAKTVELDDDALEAIEDGGINHALTVEDVGATGGTTATAVLALKKAGIESVESINFWQRNPTLPKLDELGVVYRSVILAPLPMYSPGECASSPSGYCANDIPLIEHGK